MPYRILPEQLPKQVREMSNVATLLSDYNRLAVVLASAKDPVGHSFLIDMYAVLDQVEMAITTSALLAPEKRASIKTIQAARSDLYCLYYQSVIATIPDPLCYLEFRIAARASIAAPEDDPSLYDSDVFAIPKAGALISAAESVARLRQTGNPLRTSSSSASLSSSDKKSKGSKISRGSYNIFVSGSRPGSELDLKGIETDYSWSVSEFEARLQAISELEAILVDDKEIKKQDKIKINDEITRNYRMLYGLLAEIETRQILINYLEASCIELALSNMPPALFLRDGSVNLIEQLKWMKGELDKPKKMRHGSLDFLPKNLKEKIKHTEEISDAFVKSLSPHEQILIRWGRSVLQAERRLEAELNKFAQFKGCEVDGKVTGNSAIYIINPPGRQAFVIRILSVQDNLYKDGIDCRYVRQVIFNSHARKYMAKNYGQHYLGRDENYGVINTLQITEFFPGDLSAYAEALRADTRLSEEDKASTLLEIAKEMIKMHVALHKYGVCFPDSKPSNIMLRDANNPASIVISDIKTMVRFSPHEGILPNDQVIFTEAFENKYVRPARGQYHVAMGARVVIAVGLYNMATGELPDTTHDKITGLMHDFNFKHPIFKEESGKKLRDLISALADPAKEHTVKNSFQHVAKIDTSLAAIVEAVEVALMASPRATSPSLSTSSTLAPSRK